MSVTGHLEELRWRLIRCAAYIIFASLVAFIFVDKILYILKLPSKDLIENFLILKPAEAVTIYIKTAVFAGFSVAILPIFWELFSFVKPAIDKSQNGSVIKWVTAAFTLFVCGVLFIYFIVLTPAISFLMNLSQGLIHSPVQLTLSSYISFVCALLFCGGIIFQIPLLAFILTKIGLITPRLLSSKRKEAYFGLVVFAAVITPTTDAFSLGLFVFPMIILYEIGIIFSKIVYKSKILPGGEVYEQ
ncbi:MAG: twin-arginine translocase subunit TatC [Endomicrobia bacterium]|nr:twin-arginine translocase subunit TatC [Endomicrobiia bacterium]MCL2506375.1 twin-arginine translocase subunit TatC [Endomicrobiia bacterium]